MTFNLIVFIVYVALLVLMSIVAFAVFGKDKKIAVKQNGQMRIKEKTLLTLTVLNGAVGAFIGRKVHHHKTDKVYFSITIYLSILCQALVAVVLALLAFEVF